jgi:hypothetical protein
MLQGQLSRLDLRQIEHVVDHGQQRFAGVADNRQELMLLRGQLGIEQQFAHADHRVQRRADFVAHVGQETALRLVGRFGRFLGRLQRFGRQLLFGDVTRQPNVPIICPFSSYKGILVVEAQVTSAVRPRFLLLVIDDRLPCLDDALFVGNRRSACSAVKKSRSVLPTASAGPARPNISLSARLIRRNRLCASLK